MQHHTILALASMSAAKLQLPMMARSSEVNAAPRPGHHRSTAAAGKGRLPRRPDGGGPRSPLPHFRPGSNGHPAHLRRHTLPLISLSLLVSHVFFFSFFFLFSPFLFFFFFF